jgi:hypothetical protein
MAGRWQRRVRTRPRGSSLYAPSVLDAGGDAPVDAASRRLAWRLAAGITVVGIVMIVLALTTR